MKYSTRSINIPLPFDVLSVQLCEVDQVRPEPVYDCGEGEPVPPGGAHVAHVDAGVSGGRALAPHLQGLRALHHLGWLCNWQRQDVL